MESKLEAVGCARAMTLHVGSYFKQPRHRAKCPNTIRAAYLSRYDVERCIRYLYDVYDIDTHVTPDCAMSRFESRSCILTSIKER
jgi:hypothetical protein